LFGHTTNNSSTNSSLTSFLRRPYSQLPNRHSSQTSLLPSSPSTRAYISVPGAKSKSRNSQTPTATISRTIHTGTSPTSSAGTQATAYRPIFQATQTLQFNTLSLQAFIPAELEIDWMPTQAGRQSGVQPAGLLSTILRRHISNSNTLSSRTSRAMG